MTRSYRRLSALMALVGFVVGFARMAITRSSITESIVEGVYFALVGGAVAVVLGWMGAGCRKPG